MEPVSMIISRVSLDDRRGQGQNPQREVDQEPSRRRPAAVTKCHCGISFNWRSLLLRSTPRSHNRLTVRLIEVDKRRNRRRQALSFNPPGRLFPHSS
ncbi:hypothetical protein T06_4284 [Trichinella sp. T6]|nr:hypothetical protein T06_4284 [Trichinella sp. T6]